MANKKLIHTTRASAQNAGEIGEGSGKSTEGRGKAKRTECTKIIGFSSSRRLQQLNEKKTYICNKHTSKRSNHQKGRKIYSRKFLVKLNL